MGPFAALVVLVATALLATGCTGDGSGSGADDGSESGSNGDSHATAAAPRVPIELTDSAPGDVIALLPAP